MDLADPADFSRAYELHARGAHAAAYRILGDSTQAQDVVQDVFVKLWRRPRAFDARRGELGAYLRLMARSRALDLWREAQAAGRARDRLEIAAAAAQQRPEGLPPLVAERAEARRVVTAALRELPDSQREAVALAHWGGLTAEEIARLTAVPLGTAKSRIRLGLTRLREQAGAQLAELAAPAEAA